MVKTSLSCPPFKLTLTALALWFCLPAYAANSNAGIQSPGWDDNSRSEFFGSNASQNDVWQRIRDGFKIDDAASENPLVATHLSLYAARPEYVRRIVERSRRYLYHIVQEVDRRAMPMEIALLPIIESAFVPTARSPAAASGIWQFIPSTGRNYGLKQDTWYDGRRDFTASTNAALDYLSKLYRDFGDWQLALAAYNCGEGCVARAIQKNVAQGLPTDFASLSLPSETRHYVPKLLAVKALIRTPEQFGLAIDTLPNQPYFNQVTVQQAGMDIHSAARLAGISSDEFVALNAAFPRKLIRSDTPVNLLVPVDKTDQFQRNLEAGEWDRWQPYAAQQGESLASIAQRFDVSLARLGEHNQIVVKHGRLTHAQTILVPARDRAVSSQTERFVHAAAHDAAPERSAEVPPPRATRTLAAASTQHRVKRGETLYSIARHYGLSVAALTQANPRNKGGLKAGQTLRLPADAETTQTAQANPKTDPVQRVAVKHPAKKPAQPERYTVKRGDNLNVIAQRFDVSLAEIKTWNPVFKKSSTVRAGQTLVVKKPS